MAAVLQSALFRGGYLVADAAQEPALPDAELRELVAGWRAARVGTYAVRYDDTWRSAQASAGDAEVLLLGTAMDLDQPRASQEQVARTLAAALADSDAAFLDRIDALNGAHLIFARRGERCWALQDATGIEALCYDLAGGGTLVASHPALIAAIRGYELSEHGRLWIWGNKEPLAQELRLWNGLYWFPGVATPYDEVRALTPNTRLDLATGTVERFFPRKPVGTLRERAIAGEVAGSLRDACAWIAREFPGAVEVSLSGGMDSRLTLAASREVARSLRYFTYHFPKHAGYQNDIRVAAALAERLGLEHYTFPLFAGPALKAHQPEWRRTFGGLSGNGRLTFAWVEHFPVGHVHLRSNVLELVRGFYLKNPGNWPDEFDAARLSRLFGVRGDALVPHFEEFMAVTRFDAESKLDLHYTDLFYWEQRLGRWHADAVRKLKLSHTTYVIWNSRRVLTQMLARPLEDRRRARLVYRLIERLWPEALAAPVFSGSRYVDPPESRLEARAGELGRKGRALVRRAAEK